MLYASGGAAAGTSTVTYTVAPGDTLWEVATEHYPSSEDPRTTIEAIRWENGLEGYGLKPGMRLELPRQGRTEGEGPKVSPRPPFEDTFIEDR
jgi:hypothetical protein